MKSYVESQRELIAKAGFALANTSGSSMRPLIWGGEHCAVVVALDGDPQVGDLLVFAQKRGRQQESGIIHRLVEVRSDAAGPLYITRGDNCLATEQVRPAEVIGRVAEVHRVSGYRPWHIIPTKRFAVTDPLYRAYARLWSAAWPLRRLYYRLRGRV